MSTNNTENIYATPFGGEGAPIPADKISYDGTGTTIIATDVQGAITEIDADLQNAKDDISDIEAVVTFPTDAEDGTYVLKATVADGAVTFGWVAEV